MTRHAHYFARQLRAWLAPGEAVIATSVLDTHPYSRILLDGPSALWRDGIYYAVLTEDRLFLIRTRMGRRAIERVNAGITEIAIADIQAIASIDGVLQRTLALRLANGRSWTLHTHGHLSHAAGTSPEFIDELVACHGRLAGHGARAVDGAAASDDAFVPDAAPDLVTQLRCLGALRDAGAVTSERYGALRAELRRRL